MFHRSNIHHSLPVFRHPNITSVENWKVSKQADKFMGVLKRELAIGYKSVKNI